MILNQAIELIQNFQGKSLTDSLSVIESSIVGYDAGQLNVFYGDRAINDVLMTSAVSIKQLASQINVVIHAAGILLSLPKILEPGEVIQSLSLGAGNTGRKFDLETNIRIAEYKFIDWKGGPESIRQNGVFKDFFELAEYKTEKRKILYVVGTTHTLKFLQGGRALSSVLQKQPEILARIQQTYGEGVSKTRDYYGLKKHDVEISDVTSLIGRTSEI